MISPAEAHALLSDVDVVDSGTGQAVVLAHGAAGGVLANFLPLIVAGQDEYRFTGANHPGSGSTPLRAAALTLDTLADRAVATGVLAGGTRFPMVGLSMGAAVAVTAAVRHPEQVSALVLTVGVSAADAQSLSFVDAVAGLAAAGDRRGLASLLLLCSTADALESLDEAGRESLLEVLADGFPPGGAEQLAMVHGLDVRWLLPRIAVPTLVIVGGQDRIVLPSTARAFSDIAGARVLEYPDAGHIFDDRHTARWVDDVLAFLAQHSR